MLTILAEAQIGSTIEQAIYEALTLASDMNVRVSFEFNGVPVLVTPTSKINRLVERYREQFKIIAEAEKAERLKKNQQDKAVQYLKEFFKPM